MFQLENVWTVQVRHLLALTTPTGPWSKVAKAVSITSHFGTKLAQ